MAAQGANIETMFVGKIISVLLNPFWWHRHLLDQLVNPCHYYNYLESGLCFHSNRGSSHASLMARRYLFERKVYAWIVFLLYLRLSQSVVFYFVPSIDRTYHVLVFDIFYISHQRHTMYLVISVLIFSLVCFYRSLFLFSYDKSLHSLLIFKKIYDRILAKFKTIHQDVSLFMRPINRSNKVFTNLERKVFNTTLVHNVVVVSYVYASVLFFIIVHYLVVQLVLTDRDYFLADAWCCYRLVLLELNALHLCMIMVFTIKIMSTMGHILLEFTVIIFYRLKENELRCFEPAGWTRSRLATFIRNHNHLFQQIVDMNKTFRGVLLAYFLANYETNAYFLILLLMSRQGEHYLANFFYGFYMIDQFYYIFVIHLTSINYSKRIHSFTNRLLSKSVAQMRTAASPRALDWRTSHYIQTFHIVNDRRHGLTYGSFDTISFKAFTKVGVTHARTAFAPRTQLWRRQIAIVTSQLIVQHIILC